MKKSKGKEAADLKERWRHGKSDKRFQGVVKLHKWQDTIGVDMLIHDSIENKWENNGDVDEITQWSLY